MWKIISFFIGGILKKVPTLLLAHVYVVVFIMLLLPLIFGDSVSAISDFFGSEYGRVF